MGIDRRKFLKTAAGSAAALVAQSTVAKAQMAELRTPAAEPVSPADIEVLTAERTGSDFMVDVLKSIGFEYVTSNPGSSFRGLQESLINYGGNKDPEWLTCRHGDLQRVLRPSAGIRDPWQPLGCSLAKTQAGRLGARRPGRRGHGTRHYQVGRYAHVPAALRRVCGSRL